MALNAERIYHNALVALEQHFRLNADSELSEKAKEWTEKIRRDPLAWSACKYDESIASLASILYEAGEELHKSKGGSAYAAAKRLAKQIPDSRPGCRAWIDGEGRQCFCAQAFAVRLNKPLDGLPEIPEKCEPINYESLFKPDALPSGDLSLPSVGDLKVCMAQQNKPKDSKCKTYDFGEGKPMVNAEFLKALLELLPDATAKNDKEIGTIYLSSEAGDAILLPIRKATYSAAQRSA